jgi:hypothetical protein
MLEQESGTAPDVELSSITDRMEIRQAVQSGLVEEAIDKVNDLNPEVKANELQMLCSRDRHDTASMGTCPRHAMF